MIERLSQSFDRMEEKMILLGRISLIEDAMGRTRSLLIQPETIDEYLRQI